MLEELLPLSSVLPNILPVGTHLAWNGRFDIHFCAVLEERHQPVVVLLCDRIVFVVVTLGAPYRQAEPRRTHCVRPIHQLVEAQLRQIDPAGEVIAMREDHGAT